jgi:hypothetical protein
MARLRPDLPIVSINLLRQIPMDQILGDVLLANPGVCRLIEFNRHARLTKKEFRKLDALHKALDGSDRSDFARAISRSVHWCQDQAARGGLVSRRSAKRALMSISTTSCRSSP